LQTAPLLDPGLCAGFLFGARPLYHLLAEASAAGQMVWVTAFGR